MMSTRVLFKTFCTPPPYDTQWLYYVDWLVTSAQLRTCKLIKMPQTHSVVHVLASLPKTVWNTTIRCVAVYYLVTNFVCQRHASAKVLPGPFRTIIITVHIQTWNTVQQNLYNKTTLGSEHRGDPIIKMKHSVKLENRPMNMWSQ